MTITTKLIAIYAYRTRATGIFVTLKLALPVFLVLTGCSALPDKPTRPTVYDFGPGAVVTQPSHRMAPLPTVALDEVQASAALDSTAVLYRLAYADAQALKPYAQARWSMTPAQLVRQRLREHLGLRRAVLSSGEGSAPSAAGANGAANASPTTNPTTSPTPNTATSLAATPILLRVELEEFSQLFESATASTGLLRLRATAVQASSRGEKLLGQRSIIVQRPAPSADAAGGVRALTAATDAAVEEIDQWLQQLR